MKTAFTDAELKAAYDICVLVKHNSDNVIAVLDKNECGKKDHEWSRKAGKFIKAYESIQAAKLAKSGKAGYMGDTLVLLSGIQDTLKDAGLAIDKNTL